MQGIEKKLITICTVSFGHKELIEENMRFVAEMNPDADVKWIIVENTPDRVKERFETGGSHKVKVLKGVENNFTGLARGSQHHASGLNMAIREADTKFVLILDPDCYIVRSNWINDVLCHMQKSDLAFFGIPYNPKRYLKYRYFPSLHSLFIDLEKVSGDEIDFTPQYKQ